jgi:hypothetical protein
MTLTPDELSAARLNIDRNLLDGLRKQAVV